MFTLLNQDDFPPPMLGLPHRSLTLIGALRQHKTITSCYEGTNSTTAKHPNPRQNKLNARQTAKPTVKQTELAAK